MSSQHKSILAEAEAKFLPFYIRGLNVAKDDVAHVDEKARGGIQKLIDEAEAVLNGLAAAAGVAAGTTAAAGNPTQPAAASGAASGEASSGTAGSPAAGSQPASNDAGKPPAGPAAGGAGSSAGSTATAG